jgi:hypothetical protein
MGGSSSSSRTPGVSRDKTLDAVVKVDWLSVDELIRMADEKWPLGVSPQEPKRAGKGLREASKFVH